MLDSTIHCAICGREKTLEKTEEQRWFLLMENLWEDKLKLLHWDSILAMQPSVFPVCCPLHVRELTAHWIITGNLAPASPDNAAENIPPMHFQSLEAWNVHQIGELAVHHENMRRLLDEQPQSSKPVLDALLSALEHDSVNSSPANCFSEPSPRLTNQHGNHYLHSPAH